MKNPRKLWTCMVCVLLVLVHLGLVIDPLFTEVRSPSGITEQNSVYEFILTIINN